MQNHTYAKKSNGMSKVKSALKNEYVKSLVLILIVIGGIIVFWFGLRFYFRTDYPMLAVASGSMIPTLYPGDLIIVQGGHDVGDIVAAYGTGDVIVFYNPTPTRADELIVHRAVEKENNNGVLYIKTKGDNNNNVDPWAVTDNNLVGKVVGVVPYIGNIPLFIRTTEGMILIIVIIIILVVLEFVIPSGKEKKEPESKQEPQEGIEASNEDSSKI